MFVDGVHGAFLVVLATLRGASVKSSTSGSAATILDTNQKSTDPFP